MAVVRICSFGSKLPSDCRWGTNWTRFLSLRRHRYLLHTNSAMAHSCCLLFFIIHDEVSTADVTCIGICCGGLVEIMEFIKAAFKVVEYVSWPLCCFHYLGPIACSKAMAGHVERDVIFSEFQSSIYHQTTHILTVSKTSRWTALKLRSYFVGFALPGNLIGCPTETGSCRLNSCLPTKRLYSWALYWPLKKKPFCYHFSSRINPCAMSRECNGLIGMYFMSLFRIMIFILHA